MAGARRSAVVAGLLGLWLCWGTSFPAMRVMVATLPPLLTTGAVLTVAGLVLAVASPGTLRGLTRRQVLTCAGVGGCLLLAQGAVAVAVQHVYASVAAVLVAVIPLWVAVLAALTGQRPSLPTVLRLVLGFAGVVVVLLAPGADAGWSWWALIVVAAAASWAAGSWWASRSGHLPGTRAATVIQLLCGGMALLVVGLAAGQAHVLVAGGISPPSWAAFAYLVLVDSLSGFALYNWLRAAPVALVSTYAYAVPVVAYLVGVLALGEPFRLVVLVGAAAILNAVAAEVRASTRPSASRNSP